MQYRMLKIGDDSNMAIHPEASEECDYIDNDCDELIDNEDPFSTNMVKLHLCRQRW